MAIWPDWWEAAISYVGVNRLDKEISVVVDIPLMLLVALVDLDIRSTLFNLWTTIFPLFAEPKGYDISSMFMPELRIQCWGLEPVRIILCESAIQHISGQGIYIPQSVVTKKSLFLLFLILELVLGLVWPCIDSKNVLEQVLLIDLFQDDQMNVICLMRRNRKLFHRQPNPK